jgi:ABC-type branched-subunit amino acid transport system substrate-binding protein
MPTPTTPRLLALLLLIALSAAACGTAETDGAATATPDATEPTEEVAEDEPTDAVAETATETATDEEVTADDPLTLAYLLPESGQLAFLGPPIIGGFQLAIDEINEAGGTNGVEVAQEGGDEGDGDGTIANQTADRLLAAGVDGIVGAASSGISLTVIDKITGAGVAMCSPSNTSPTFTDYDDDGLYFRAAPTDALQGPVLAEQILAAGGSDVAILARADDYGQGLLDATTQALEDAGASVAAAITYDPMAQSFDAEVQQVVDSGADAVALVAFDEGARILSTMIERGVGPADLVVFGADGLNSGDLGTLVAPDEPGILAGMGVTAPASSSSEEFQSELEAFAPELEDFGFAGEAYDCAIAMALAAHLGGANTAEAIADNMVAVTGGDGGGTTCTSFAECKDLIDAGEDIDYDGASGPMDFTEAGEPSVGTYDVKQFDDAGELITVETITSS